MLTYNQEQMVYWIKERESIRIKKERGDPKPWSDNRVMRETYFCNIDRENDTVTKWIRENWYYNLAPDYYDFAMIVARIFNLPDTLSELGQPTDTHNWLLNAREVLEDRKFEDKRIWNGAYIISTNGKKIDKLTYCLDMLKKVALDPNITDNSSTLNQAHKKLMKVDGLASFLAGQVVADLKNSHGHPLQSAPDWMTFSAPGPGSLRGLSWFWDNKVVNKSYGLAIQEAYEILSFELPEEILENLCMQNLQNCFCEYDKFMRVSQGTGRSKRKYKG